MGKTWEAKTSVQKQNFCVFAIVVPAGIGFFGIIINGFGHLDTGSGGILYSQFSPELFALIGFVFGIAVVAIRRLF